MPSADYTDLTKKAPLKQNPRIPNRISGAENQRAHKIVHAHRNAKPTIPPPASAEGHALQHL